MRVNPLLPVEETLLCPCATRLTCLALYLFCFVSRLRLAVFAGTETILEEAWPGEHDFYYPVIFEGSATDCTVSERLQEAI